MATGNQLFLTEPGDSGPIAITDLNQGWMGDCWVLGTMGGIALEDPGAIENMFKSNADGSYTVTLYGSQSGQNLWFNNQTLVPSLQTVTVSGLSDVGVNTETTSTTVNGQPELWAPLMEEAMAQVNSGYDAMGQGGQSSTSIQQLTGHHPYFTQFHDTSASNVQALLNAGDFLTLTTGVPNDGLVSDHVYTVTGVTSYNGQQSLQLYNPWGYDEPPPISFDRSWENYWLTVGVAPSTPASPGVPEIDTVGTGLDTIVLALSESTPGPDAQIAVSVDGAQVDGDLTVSTQRGGPRDQTLVLQGSWGAGPHTVSISLLNAAAPGQSGPSAYVDGAAYDAIGDTNPALAVTDSTTQSLVVGMPNKASVYGMVEYLQNNSYVGLSGVTVSATNSSGQTTSVVTDQDGSYDMAGVPDGTYTLTDAMPSGYYPSSPSDASRTISIQNGTDSMNMIVLTPTPPAPPPPTPAVSAPQLAIQQGDLRVAVGTPFSISLPSGLFTPPQGQSETYAVTGTDGKALPSWLSWDPAQNTLSGAVPAGASPVGVRVAATSSSGGMAEQAFHIYGTASAPTLAHQEDDQRLKAGSGFSFSLPAGSFADPSGGSVFLGVSGAGGVPLPSWVSYDAATQTFSGTTPNSGGAQQIEVKATTSEGMASAEGFKIYTAAPSLSLARQQDDIRVAPGQAFSATLPGNSFADPSGGTVSLQASQVDGTALPSWLRFDASSGILSGTAPSGANTAEGIRVTGVSTSGALGAEAFKIYAAENPTLAAQSRDQRIGVGQAFSFSLAANTFTDASGSPISLQVETDTLQPLPSWLGYNAGTETFSGTAPNAAGSIGIRVDALTGAGGHSAEAFHLYAV